MKLFVKLNFFIINLLFIFFMFAQANSNPIPLSPINVNLQLNSVQLEWSMPPASYPVTEFEIYIRKSDNTNTMSSFVLHGKAYPVSSGKVTYNVSNLLSGTLYDIKIVAKNNLAYFDSSIISVSTIVPEPTNVVSTPNNNSVTLSFQPINSGSPIIDYVVEYRPANDPNAPFVIFNDEVGTKNSINVTGLANGTQYEFKVYGVTKDGKHGNYSKIIVATPSNAPSAPLNLTANQGLISESVGLAWFPPEKNGGSPIIDYIIEYKKTGDNNWIVFSDGISSTTMAYVNNLTLNQSYDFRAKAKNSYSEGPYSNVVSFTPSKVNPQPVVISGTPSVLGVVNFIPGDQSVTATWIPGLSGDCPITHYIAEYKKSTETVWREHKNTDPSLNQMIIMGLNNGTPYDFRLLAVNCKGRGEVTKIHQVTPTPNVKPCLPIITRYMKRGQFNDEGNVKRLQDFLRDDEKIYNGKTTGIFDLETYNAVVRFQEKYYEDVLKPWKLKKGSGWVYITTTKKVNDLYCQYHKNR